MKKFFCLVICSLFLFIFLNLSLSFNNCYADNLTNLDNYTTAKSMIVLETTNNTIKSDIG